MGQLMCLTSMAEYRSINLRFPVDLLDQVDQAAKTSGLDRSNWLRAAAFEKLNWCTTSRRWIQGQGKSSRTCCCGWSVWKEPCFQTTRRIRSHRSSQVNPSDKPEKLRVLVIHNV